FDLRRGSRLADIEFFRYPPGPRFANLLSFIGRMPWISGPTVGAYITAIAALLFLLLDTPVARSAQGLQVTIPKRPFIALVWHDMIGISRGDNLPILQTNCAKRVQL